MDFNERQDLEDLVDGRWREQQQYEPLKIMICDFAVRLPLPLPSNRAQRHSPFLIDSLLYQAYLIYFTKAVLDIGAETNIEDEDGSIIGPCVVGGSVWFCVGEFTQVFCDKRSILPIRKPRQLEKYFSNIQLVK